MHIPHTHHLFVSVSALGKKMILTGKMQSQTLLQVFENFITVMLMGTGDVSHCQIWQQPHYLFCTQLHRHTHLTVAALAR